MIRLNWQDNPLALRLSRNEGPFGGRRTFFISLGTGCFISCLVLLSTAANIDTRAGIMAPPQWQSITFLVSLILMISLPIFLTYVATAVTVTYTQSEEYPFLCLTTLPARQMVHAYVWAAFYRCRAISALVLSLCITLSLVLKSGSGALRLSLYPSTLGGGLWESFLKHLLFGGLLAAFLVTVSLLGVSLGIMLGLWWRHAIVANATAVVATSVFTAWWLNKVGEVARWRLEWEAFAFDTGQMLLFMPLPWLLAWLALRLARRWTRFQRGRLFLDAG